VNRKTFALAFLSLGFASLAAFAGCNGSAIDGQGQGCTKDADCPTGNSLKCTPLKSGNGGTCQILCDPSKASVCPNNETCAFIAASYVPVCVFHVSGSGGSGTTGATTGSTTAATTSTGG